MNKELPKVLFIQTVNPGITYYRMYCFAKRMHDLGLVTTALFPEFHVKEFLTADWQSNLMKDALQEISKYADWADMVVCQYVNSAEGLSVIEAIRDIKPCFMEIDDYISAVPYYSCAYDDNKPGERVDFWSIRQIIESTGVIVATDFLKDVYKQYNQNIHVIPNAVNFDAWDKYKSHSNEKIRIGWIGGATHGGDLKIVKEVLYDLLVEFKNLEVYIVTCPPPDWPKADRMNLVNKWVAIDNYPQHLKNLSFDIGISPLRDNYFNRAKSNLRYLEYSACRIPTVASNVEPFKTNFIGFLADDEMDWFEQLSLLIQDQDLRLNTGFMAYYDVKDKFNLDGIARKYAKLIEGALNGSFDNRKSYIESAADSSNRSVECNNTGSNP